MYTKGTVRTVPFVYLITFFLYLQYAATEQDDDLGGEDAKEHAQRINRRIADGWCLAVANAVGVGEGRGIGIGTCQHTHDGEIVELEFHAGNGADNQDRVIRN